MNRIVPYISSIVAIAITGNVQAQESRSIWLTASAGVCTSIILNQNAYGNGEQDYSTTLGYVAGAGARYLISNKFGVTSTVSLVKLGQNYRGVQSSGEANRKVNLDYIELPLLAMYRITNAQNTTWIAFGPDIMFLVSAKQKYNRKDGNPLPKPDYLIEGSTDVKDRFKPIDLAINFSLNRIFDIDYRKRNLLLLMSANMTFGLTDINSNDWRIPNMHGNYAGSHNFYMGIRAGLMYRAFKK
jgi:hypothetical protein